MSGGMGDRTKLILGEEGMERLRGSFVVVCGAGAVGGYAIEALVRAGVGRLRVVDADVFGESNLNRQVLATVDTIGRRKAEVAGERARSINPDIVFEPVCSMVSPDTIPEILSGNPDAVVDAIDTIGFKTELLRAVADSSVRTFSSMGAALHFDPTAVRIATLKKTKVCPLASAVRSRLRDKDTSNITCVYSEEPPMAKPDQRDEHGKSVLGSLPTIPAIFGMTLANEAIRYLIGR